jgi:hypothetical protein
MIQKQIFVEWACSDWKICSSLAPTTIKLLDKFCCTHNTQSKLILSYNFIETVEIINCSLSVIDTAIALLLSG